MIFVTLAKQKCLPEDNADALEHVGVLSLQKILFIYIYIYIYVCVCVCVCVYMCVCVMHLFVWIIN